MSVTRRPFVKISMDRTAVDVPQGCKAMATICVQVYA